MHRPIHIDNILCMKPTGIPLFLLTLFLVFCLSFNVAGRYLSDPLAEMMDRATELLSIVLTRSGASAVLHGLVIDGICAGVGSVLSFIPIIATLFFLLSLLDESGYLPMVASLLDAPMKKAGLSGRCVVPLVMSFGCAVPAVMAAGSMLNGRERDNVIALIPFMPCSAKLPVYAVFVSVFFEEHRAVVMLLVYSISVFVAAIYSAVLRHSHRAPCLKRSGNETRGQSAGRFYRAPDMRRVSRAVLVNAAGFIKKAFTVVLVASVVIWFLRSFDPCMNMTADIEDSMLASLGERAAPFFAPLGFGDWRAASAMIAGLTAKESIISTFAIMSDIHSGALSSTAPLLSDIFSPLSAFSFMIFCLLYVPCAATLAVVRSQTGSAVATLKMIIVHIAVPWISSYIFYAFGSFITGIM